MTEELYLSVSQCQSGRRSLFFDTSNMGVRQLYDSEIIQQPTLSLAINSREGGWHPVAVKRPALYATTRRYEK